MAEPHANTQNEPTRSRESAGKGSQGEPRSFDEAGREGAIAAQGAGEVARTAAEGGRRVAQAGAEAGRNVAESWRRTFDPFMAFQLDVNRWFDDFWRQAVGFDGVPALRMLRPFGHMGAGGLFGPPPADLKETKDAYLLSLELPGLARDDVDISLQGDMLNVCGQKIEENEDASSAYRVSERRFGRFERSFPLPPDADRGRIEAQFRDGVLKISLAKRPGATPPRSKIEIRT
ncbi:MAG TPA: Hsp20/alpha crystallin family protein [Caulobacteraceae bacterium]|nr:Hsp20/alpha crystallin family protein [Caulobacteraceae bacterium]